MTTNNNHNYNYNNHHQRHYYSNDEQEQEVEEVEECCDGANGADGECDAEVCYVLLLCVSFPLLLIALGIALWGQIAKDNVVNDIAKEQFISSNNNSSFSCELRNIQYHQEDVIEVERRRQRRQRQLRHDELRHLLGEEGEKVGGRVQQHRKLPPDPPRIECHEYWEIGINVITQIMGEGEGEEERGTTTTITTEEKEILDIVACDNKSCKDCRFTSLSDDDVNDDDNNDDYFTILFGNNIVDECWWSSTKNYYTILSPSTRLELLTKQDQFRLTIGWSIFGMDGFLLLCSCCSLLLLCRKRNSFIPTITSSPQQQQQQHSSSQGLVVVSPDLLQTRITVSERRRRYNNEEAVQQQQVEGWRQELFELQRLQDDTTNVQQQQQQQQQRPIKNQESHIRKQLIFNTLGGEDENIDESISSSIRSIQNMNQDNASDLVVQQQQQQQQQKASSSSSSSTSWRSWKDRYSWMLQQPSPLTYNASGAKGKQQQQQECVICLDTYQIGDTIAWTKNNNNNINNKKKVDEEEEEEEEDVDVVDDENGKNCIHIFHEECIIEWLKYHDECPLCRTKIIV